MHGAVAEWFTTASVIKVQCLMNSYPMAGDAQLAPAGTNWEKSRARTKPIRIAVTQAQNATLPFELKVTKLGRICKLDINRVTAY